MGWSNEHVWEPWLGTKLIFVFLHYHKLYNGGQVEFAAKTTLKIMKERFIKKKLIFTNWYFKFHSHFIPIGGTETRICLNWSLLQFRGLLAPSLRKPTEIMILVMRRPDCRHNGSCHCDHFREKQKCEVCYERDLNYFFISLQIFFLFMDWTLNCWPHRIIQE